MGEFILKEIEFELTPASIQKAIDTVKKLQKDLGRALSELSRVLMDKGVEVAQIEISSMGAVDTGTLFEHIYGFYNESTHTGAIFTDAPYAIYVEYGTGIVGAGSPHPQPGKAGWNYDKNNHGEEGWWYPSPTGWYIPKGGLNNEDKLPLAWTKGMPSRPFMYNTMRELEVFAKEEGGRIIANYIP